MKTTLGLPDPLIRRVIVRAASEGRKLKEIISDLLEKGLGRASGNNAARRRTPLRHRSSARLNDPWRFSDQPDDGLAPPKEGKPRD